MPTGTKNPLPRLSREGQVLLNAMLNRSSSDVDAAYKHYKRQSRQSTLHKARAQKALAALTPEQRKALLQQLLQEEVDRQESPAKLTSPEAA